MLGAAAAAGYLRELAAAAPASAGPLVGALTAAELSAAPTGPGGLGDAEWRLEADGVLCCLGVFRPAQAIAELPASDELAQARSCLFLDRSAVTTTFHAVAAESRHHDALCVTQSTLREMAAVADGSSAGHAAARRNLRLLLASGSRLRVIGFADEEAVRAVMPERYGLDPGSLPDVTAAVAAELRKTAAPGNGSQPMAVTVFSRNVATRRACHQAAVPVLPVAL